jgi:hypothetical protein
LLNSTYGLDVSDKSVRGVDWDENNKWKCWNN